MGVIQNLFAGRSRAQLALDFGAETITLLAEDLQADQGWTALAEATLADENFAEQIDAMRTVAEEHSADCAVDLWLPNDQILNTHLALEGAQFWRRITAAKAVLATRTGLEPEEINVDLARAPGDVWAVCAVEATVAKEAQDYARRWGFAPAMVTTRHADAAFAAPPNLTGEVDRRPLIIGAGVGVAAAAGIAVAAFVWPSSQTPPVAQGPERIAMAPAAALMSPAALDATAIALPDQTTNVVPVALPAAPKPDYATAADLTYRDHDFEASILSPAPQFPSFLSVDFSLPRGDVATPIYANVAYSAPSLGHSTPAVEAIEQYFASEQPALGPASLPSLTLDAGREDTADQPSELGAFDVAALGPAPQALRSEDLILQTEATSDVAQPEQATGAEPAPEADNEASTQAETETKFAPPKTEPPTIVQNATDPREAAPQPEIAEVDEAPGPGSVTAAPRPGKRPDSLDMSPGPGAVAAAPSALTRPKSIKPKPVVVARNTSSAKTVRAPARGAPTGRGLAGVATLRGAIELDKTSLLGVFGTSKNRRALLRMSDGRMKRVSQGEVIDGWVISRIQATSMRMTRGAEVRNLQLIR